MEEEEMKLEFFLMSRDRNAKWIHERLTQIRQYRELQGCVAGAKAILKVVQNYELKGDFGPIKRITDVVRYFVTPLSTSIHGHSG